MSASNSSAPAFPFLKLLTEIRVMIYEYLVVAPNAEPSVVPDRPWGRVEVDVHTSILSVNRLVYGEASAILYAKNNVGLYMHGFCDKNIGDSIFKVDLNPGRPTSSRSGRSIKKRTHSGIIYPHVLQRFARITLIVIHYSVKLYPPGNQRLLESEKVMRLFRAPADGAQSEASRVFSLELRIPNFERRREMRKKGRLLDLCGKDGIIDLLKDMRKRRTVAIQQGNLPRVLRLAIEEDED